MLLFHSFLLGAKHCGKRWRCKDEQDGVPINQDLLHSGKKKKIEVNELSEF